MKDKLLKTGLATCVFLALFATGCQKKTGQLSAELQARFEKEGIAHRADDLTFRRTHVAGDEEGSWDKKRASIIVTSTSVFLHENGKPLVEITPRSTGVYEVHREKDRISLRAGSGKSALSWSFRPPDDADKWTIAIRSVIKNAKTRPSGD
ncbi:MAG TPA: hypothetical protein VF626_06425 [Chthoniobacterales bacterium]